MVSYDVLIFYEFNSKTHLLTTRCDGCIRCCNKTITGDMQIGSRTILWHKCKWLVSDGFVFSISATAILTSNSFWWDGPHGHCGGTRLRSRARPRSVVGRSGFPVPRFIRIPSPRIDVSGLVPSGRNESVASLHSYCSMVGGLMTECCGWGLMTECC
jgi:hypothetical protein